MHNFKNHHATVIEICGHGLMIEGQSGAGKTSLALGLIEQFNLNGKTACLISDDQVLLEVVDKGDEQRLRAHRPDAIAGKVEIRGFGISNLASKANCEIDLIVELLGDEKIERMPSAKFCYRNGVRCAYIQVPERHEAQSIRIIRAKLNALFDFE